MSSVHELLHAEREHLSKFFPDHEHEEFTWTTGPIRESLPHMRVRRISSKRPGEPVLYFSVGAGEATVSESHSIEFFLMAPEEDARHVELVTMVANLHADPAYRVHLGKIINIGRPWVQGALASFLLVSLPFPFGPQLERCDYGPGHVQFLWLVPIFESEARLANERGLEALERALEAAQVNVVSPNRPPVV